MKAWTKKLCDNWTTTMPDRHGEENSIQRSRRAHQRGPTKLHPKAAQKWPKMMDIFQLATNEVSQVSKNVDLSQVATNTDSKSLQETRNQEGGRMSNTNKNSMPRSPLTHPRGRPPEITQEGGSLPPKNKHYLQIIPGLPWIRGDRPEALRHPPRHGFIRSGWKISPTSWT